MHEHTGAECKLLMIALKDEKPLVIVKPMGCVCMRMCFLHFKILANYLFNPHRFHFSLNGKPQMNRSETRHQTSYRRTPEELTCKEIAKDAREIAKSAEYHLFYKRNFFVTETQLTVPEDVNAMRRVDKFRVNDFPVKQRPTESL